MIEFIALGLAALVGSLLEFEVWVHQTYRQP